MRNDKGKIRTRVNYQIRVPEVRVVSSEGEQLGVMTTQEAIKIAEEEGYDLVEVSPTARPPVCRIMDYGKFKYEKNKRERISKKKQHVIQVKELKFRPKTEEHDYQFKKRHAEDFLSKMNKVKFTVIFRGRELDHKELGKRILKRVEEDLAEFGSVERGAMFEGRLMTMIMAPHPAKQVQKPRKQEDSSKTKDATAEDKPAKDVPAGDTPAEAAAPTDEAKTDEATKETPREQTSIETPPETQDDTDGGGEATEKEG